MLFVPGIAAVTESFSVQFSAEWFDISIYSQLGREKLVQRHVTSLQLAFTWSSVNFSPPTPTPGPQMPLRSELTIKANHCHESFKKVDGGK